MEQRQPFLRFSLGGTAFQAVSGALFVLFGAWLFYTYAFQLESAPEGSRRGAWLADFLRSNNGAPGIVFGATIAFCFGWWTWQAGLRFMAGGRAATLTSRGLILHSTYRRRGEIPFEDVVSAAVEQGTHRGSWLLRVHHLIIHFRNRRHVQLHSVAIEGGKEALRAFAEELNSRRTVTGRNGDKY